MSVEEIAASLVREFLSRKGLKQTLAKMDEELPRTPESISNRVVLAKALHIEKLMKRNKEKSSPLQTMIEVVAKYLIDKTDITSSKTSQNSFTTFTDHIGSTISGENPMVRVGIASQKLPSAAETHQTQSVHPYSVLLGDSSQKPVIQTGSSRSTRRGQESRRHGFKPRGITEWESDRERSFGDQQPGGKIEAPNINKSTTDVAGERTKGKHTGFAAEKVQSKPETGAKSSVLGDLLCEDLEDLDLSMRDQGMEHSSSRTAGSSISRTPTGSPISLMTAKGLRELIFGSATAPSFNSEWRRQDFTFCELPSLEYGLVQHKGGPCGILACIQAYILRHLLFSEPQTGATDHHISPERRNAALVAALTEILWMLGRQSGTATVALPPSSTPLQHTTQLPSRSYIPDHITERVILYKFSDRPSLEEFLSSHVFIFQDESRNGCIHFLLSALLSKGIDSVRSDMDDGGGPLIAAHSYCSQELVNLLLTGYAVSNVFDGELTLDSGATQKSVLLRGIPEQSQIGFLSLFEHYGNCIVGSNYKEPVFPIWVVCSESHFTVLFSHQRHLLSNWQLEKKFDLFYYDGLGNQDAEIRLTIDTSTHEADEVRVHQTNRDLESPLQLCIQTKWGNATVDWNGTEPLL